MAGAFLVGGLELDRRCRSRSRASTVLIASFAVGLTFAWKKIPIDTMVQESLPDGYRGPGVRGVRRGLQPGAVIARRRSRSRCSRTWA